MKRLIFAFNMTAGLLAPLFVLASPAVLSEKLYHEPSWTIVESQENGIVISEQEIPGLKVKAVKVSQLVDIDPEILAKVIEDITNYGQFLTSAPGMECRLLEEGDNYQLGYQYVEVPLISDRIYAFKMYRPDTSQTRVDWELVPQNSLGNYSLSDLSGTYIDVGVGSWSMDQRPDGQFDVSYRLVMDPGGWIPDTIADYFNRVSIVGIFKDAIVETERRSEKGNS